MRPLVVAVDFDGTIAEYKYPKLGTVVPGAVYWMGRFRELGARLILLTMRGGRELADAVEFCRARGVEFWAVNGNPEQSSWTDSPKVYAHMYIDDAAVGCPLMPFIDRPVVDWGVVGPAVEARILEHNRASGGGS